MTLSGGFSASSPFRPTLYGRIGCSRSGRPPGARDAPTQRLTEMEPTAGRTDLDEGAEASANPTAASRRRGRKSFPSSLSVGRRSATGLGPKAAEHKQHPNSRTCRRQSSLLFHRPEAANSERVKGSIDSDECKRSFNGVNCTSMQCQLLVDKQGGAVNLDYPAP